MELKPGYKQTEVGVIPEDWDVATVSDTCDLVVDCKNRTPPFVSHSEFAVVRTSNVRNGRFVDVDLRFTDYESFRRWTSRTTPKTGDIMLTREAPLGEVCAVPETPSVCLGQRMMLLRPSGHLAQSSYLLFTLMSEVVKGNLLKKIGGSTVGHAKVDDIRLLPVPLPPLEEQKHISAILLDVDNLVRDLESLIAKKQGVKQAAMQELLTGKRRLPGFEGEWEVTRLGDCVEKIAGGGTPSRSNPIFWGDEIPWATVKDLSHFHLTQTQESITRIGLANSSSCLIPAGTLIASTRMALGKAVIYDADVAINQDLKAIFFKRSASARFFYYWFEFNAPAIDAMGGGSTVKGISISQLKSLGVPDLDLYEQNTIAEALVDLDIEIETLEARLSKTRCLKQGMMQQLLTGKIRLT